MKFPEFLHEMMPVKDDLNFMEANVFSNSSCMHLPHLRKRRGESDGTPLRAMKPGARHEAQGLRHAMSVGHAFIGFAPKMGPGVLHVFPFCRVLVRFDWLGWFLESDAYVVDGNGNRL
ncbi:MAG: hypothetical protein LBP92_04595 [Deltaproteobacteria bacterium]|jgi:hypothetical protein|nr:hypothetical protein [Deltaproteobacteria bacterium]